ncbi:nuclear transport factor 2 family protein [Arthrobacter mobilis]|uniref:Nuclear transport factor 2 family protein n=1 Tax=Arthrobacter mobilis TaxID=2724944 RepID=A0A7X6H9U0_9MICC|nr:nuclear transport factor 2 family protein [Arthrobacter mobilis]NKX53127.1 nuclear transport factor 2 family protein [Arthrobacter mobilis]
MIPTTHQTVELAEGLYQAYNDRNLDAWLSCFAEDALWLNIPTGERYVGPEGQKDNFTAWNTPFPRGRCEDLVIRGGDGFVVAEFNGVGVHEGPLATPEGEVAPTFKSTSLAFCDVHTVRDGKITETHRYWDLAGAAAQLGL